MTYKGQLFTCCYNLRLEFSLTRNTTSQYSAYFKIKTTNTFSKVSSFYIMSAPVEIKYYIVVFDLVAVPLIMIFTGKTFLTLLDASATL